jgi:hypothetical protein
MARKKKSTHPTTSVGLHGFYRVAIVNEDGTIAGDSGVHHNLIVSGGLTNYLTYVFAASAGSSVIGMAALGSGSLVATNATIIPNAQDTSLYKTVSKTFITRAASSDGDTARYLATWASGTSTANISNVGLVATTGVAFFCGGTYASSSVASNQAVNLTYDCVFLASSS